MPSEMQRLRCLAAHVDVEPRPVAASMIAPSEARLDAGSVSVDANVYLANRLTPLERDQFARDGYFVVENAIPESLSAQMRDVLSQIRAEKVDAGTLGANEQSKQGAFSQANTLQTQEPVLALLTNERVFSKVVDILGVNIFCYVSCHCDTPGVSACGHASCQRQPQTCVFAKGAPSPRAALPHESAPAGRGCQSRRSRTSADRYGVLPGCAPMFRFSQGHRHGGRL